MLVYNVYDTNMQYTYATMYSTYCLILTPELINIRRISHVAYIYIDHFGIQVRLSGILKVNDKLINRYHWSRRVY